jgi:hypothetical protein
MVMVTHRSYQAAAMRGGCPGANNHRRNWPPRLLRGFHSWRSLAAKVFWCSLFTPFPALLNGCSHSTVPSLGWKSGFDCAANVVAGDERSASRVILCLRGAKIPFYLEGSGAWNVYVPRLDVERARALVRADPNLETEELKNGILRVTAH